jgi:hypothetical protein
MRVGNIKRLFEAGRRIEIHSIHYSPLPYTFWIPYYIKEKQKSSYKFIVTA